MSIGSQPVQAVRPTLPRDMADKIAKVVNSKFAELTNGTPFALRKVLSGIVQTSNSDPDTAKLIALATGTKCLNGEHINDCGNALNDCHAEVIAKRCLRHYLLKQLDCTLNGQEDTIYEQSDDGFYHVKPTIQLHLYISTAPCGDSRIFSPHEVDLAKTEV